MGGGEEPSGWSTTTGPEGWSGSTTAGPLTGPPKGTPAGASSPVLAAKDALFIFPSGPTSDEDFVIAARALRAAKNLQIRLNYIKTRDPAIWID